LLLFVEAIIPIASASFEHSERVISDTKWRYEMVHKSGAKPLTGDEGGGKQEWKNGEGGNAEYWLFPYVSHTKS
jgi:hypothetical protein